MNHLQTKNIKRSMEKEYVSPETTIYQMDVEQPLLSGSDTMSFSDDEYTPTESETDWWFD